MYVNVEPPGSDMIPNKVKTKQGDTKKRKVKVDRVPVLRVPIISVSRTLGTGLTQFVQAPEYPGNWRDSALLAPQVPWGLAGNSLFSPQVLLGLAGLSPFMPPGTPGAQSFQSPKYRQDCVIQKEWHWRVID